MPALYRVFPYLPTAADDEPGGGLYVPPQRGGRLDNPAAYSVLYFSNAAAGAIAEAFGRFPEWTPALLRGSPAMPGSVRAIARFRLANDSPVCDLDDPAILAALGLRPSDVVSRNYTRTRAWALRIYEQRKWHGLRWWPYYDPRWASFGLWNANGVELTEVTPLRIDDPALQEASRIIARRVVLGNP